MGHPPELVCFLCSLTFFFCVLFPILRTLVSYACRKERFRFFSCSVLLQKTLPFFFVLRDFFLYVRVRRTSTYEHVVAEHHQVSTSTTVPQAPQAQHSTAQRSQPAQQAAKQVRSDQSATTQASRRSWLAPACRRAYVYTARCSKNERRNQDLLGLQKYCWWCDAQRVRLYAALSLPPFFFVHTCGVRAVLGDHGAPDICKSLVCTENHGPLCAVQLFAFC